MHTSEYTWYTLEYTLAHYRNTLSAPLEHNIPLVSVRDFVVEPSYVVSEMQE